MKISKEKFIQDYQNLTYEQMAAKYHISRSSVRNLVKVLGLSKPVGRKKSIELFEEVTSEII